MTFFQPAGATTLPIQKTFSIFQLERRCQQTVPICDMFDIRSLHNQDQRTVYVWLFGVPVRLPQVSGLQTEKKSVGLEMSRNLGEKKKRPHFLCLAPSLEGAGNGSQRFLWFCKECGLFIGLPFLFWTE